MSGDSAARAWSRLVIRCVGIGFRPSGHAALGRYGERRAAWYLRLHGYRIIARNLRNDQGEIDLIARRRGVIAFIEVKTRGPGSLGEGWTAVNREKQLRVMRAAEGVLARVEPPPREVRFDIISIGWDGERLVLDHFMDAFRPFADPVRPWRWV